MPNYQNSKIYKLWSPSCNEIYIGSTTQKLSVRMGGHKRSFKSYKNNKQHFITSFHILEYEDARIDLIEKCPCNDKEELRKIEGEYIKKYECVNRCVAGRTSKEYYESNKEDILEKNKKYYESNRMDVRETQKKYYENNRSEKLEYRKKYYEQNKKKISEYQKIKMTCECGSIIRYKAKARHYRSIKHKKYTESKET